jgi:hypothetical protein
MPDTPATMGAETFRATAGRLRKQAAALQASYVQQDIENLANIYELLAATAEQIQSIDLGVPPKSEETRRP